MTITLNLPDEAAERLREAFGPGLDQAAFEALVIEGYRARKFGIASVRRLLGLGSRWEAEEWLGKRGVTWNYSAEDLEADRRTLDQVLGPAD